MTRLVAEKTEINRILKNAYNALKRGEFEEGIGLLQKASGLDSELPEITEALRCAAYWRERKEKSEHMDHYGRSEYLMDEWNNFAKTLSPPERLAPNCFYGIKHHISTLALENYLALADANEIFDFESLLRIGRLYKGLGNYESAIEILEHANQVTRNDPQALAELADCYAQIDEVKPAKLFFREAFFIDPRAVDLEALESPFMHALINKIRENGKKEEEVGLWIPVYGAIYGVFNMKRELKPIEIGKLKQAVSGLEQKLHEKKEDVHIIIPLLLNKYFWLIDHYVGIKAPAADIDALLLKIKDTDEDIYLQYIK
jgi:tetratricopeptide (TPR) repeat protein